MEKQNKKQVTFAFIDATNIIYGARNSGWRMNFQKLYHYLRNRFQCTKILYYAGVDNENIKQLHFYEKLQEFGYSLRLVPVKTFKDGKKKADVDSRMTFEIMKYFSRYDAVIIMTGDGDFYWVLEYLIRIKKTVKLIAHGNSTARELKRLFGYRFTDLVSLRWMLEETVKKNGTDSKAVSVPRDYAKSIAKVNSFVKKKKTHV